MRGVPNLTALVFSLALVSVSGCRYWTNTPETAYKSETVSQIWSFSMSGRGHASVILRNRELRLTTDGGQTWQVIPPAAVADAFESAMTIDGRRGWALNHQGHVFSTDSGGATWTKISELHEFTCSHQIEFVNEKDGWIRECLSLWRTQDGGVTWTKTLSTITPGVLGQPTGMFPFDANTLVASGSGGQVYSTNDGGGTWRIHSPFSGDNIDLNDVWFVDRRHGWVTGYQVLVAGESLRPLLFETTDGGDSWKQVSVDADILPSSVCFVGDHGWLAGSRRIVNGDSVRLEGVLLRTTDGGIHWQPVELGPNEPFLIDVRFADKNHGWVVGRDTLYRTEDGGTTWKRVLSLPPLA
jgi:photosystem II stability/assembly factor-like uncharacterized protein